MQSETIFTATSGHRCQYEVLIDEGGRADANVVWLNGPPSARDQGEFERFIEEQAKQAGFPHSGTQRIVLGEIAREDVPRAGEIFRERIAALTQEPATPEGKIICQRCGATRKDPYCYCEALPRG